MIDCREAVLIVNKRGLHARASAKFVNHVAELPAGVSVTVSKDGTCAAGNSILGLMMLGAAKGDTVEIACSGDGADVALAALAALVRGGFGEE
ncbi:HPr family phosphocarrier protein [Novosphingobium beihaiensis]|uniref:HPr family phosphocarrier protein n=1 Tax=Novosphingobium beihaiensis TaxID=2930389 RepID=A0ABT0BLZ1_9SPHN|nr:HPr family phosphocarrier protein [Novosphingobium beihaiensis]MCJ2186073.1 HPr family phosphocarrier protein [Novosphingobium beihaiensis]